MEENPKEEVLIARNNETGQVGAVVGQNPDGTPKMADVKSTPLSELVKFTKGQNPLEAFTANFMRQAKNPTTFGIFKMSAGDYEALAEPMAEMLNDPETNKEMLDKYRVEPKTAGKKNTPVDADLIDWATIQKDCGLTREDLEKSGALEQMLYNHKSPQLFNLKANIAGETYDVQARLTFRTNPDGSSPTASRKSRNSTKSIRATLSTTLTRPNCVAPAISAKSWNSPTPRPGKCRKAS